MCGSMEVEEEGGSEEAMRRRKVAKSKSEGAEKSGRACGGAAGQAWLAMK